jgi:DNA-binding IclR family transcriptional regulator
MDSDGVAARIVSIMWAFSHEANAVLTLKEIAVRCALPQPTTHRLLKQLLDLGIVARAPQRRYRMGSDFQLLGLLVSRRSQLIEALRPLLEEVVREFDVACLLSLYVPSKRARVVLDRIEPQGADARRFVASECKSLIRGAAGKSILAFLRDDELDSVLEDTRSIGGAKSSALPLRENLAEIRSRGYAIVHGEVTPQKSGIAVPLLGANREVMGNITAVRMSSRWNGSAEQRTAAFLMDQSTRASAILRSQFN